MIYPLVLLALAALPAAIPTDEFTGIASDQVDVVEVNHYYDDEGEHVFDQLIFRDWDYEANRFQVRAWRLLKSPSQLPARNFQTGTYDVLWHDGDTTRRVEAKVFRESWTQHDPEMRERSFLPKEQRMELYSPRLFSDRINGIEQTPKQWTSEP